MKRLGILRIKPEVLFASLGLADVTIYEGRLGYDGMLELRIEHHSLPACEPGKVIPFVELVVTRSAEFKVHDC